MYPECARRATFYEGLRRIDEDLAERIRRGGCPECDGPLDHAGWLRKPRGCGADLPDAVCERLGLCCRRCRQRVLPPSTVFLGRKVYFGAIVLLTIAAKQRRLVGTTARALRELFGVSRDTLSRWFRFWSVEFPSNALWKQLRGRVSPLVRDDALPDALLAQFDQQQGAGPAAAQAFLVLLAAPDSTLREG